MGICVVFDLRGTVLGKATRLSLSVYEMSLGDRLEVVLSSGRPEENSTSLHKRNIETRRTNAGNHIEKPRQNAEKH